MHLPNPPPGPGRYRPLLKFAARLTQTSRTPPTRPPNFPGFYLAIPHARLVKCLVRCSLAIHDPVMLGKPNRNCSSGLLNNVPAPPVTGTPVPVSLAQLITSSPLPPQKSRFSQVPRRKQKQFAPAAGANKDAKRPGFWAHWWCFRRRRPHGYHAPSRNP